jgi:hypothetical protein
MSKGWIGVDLDKTLAEYTGWKGVNHIGEPIPAMLERVKAWLEQGEDVRIFTARVCEHSPKVVAAIENWCKQHIGRVIPITNCKDYDMRELWDDRAVAVEANTGRILGGNGIDGFQSDKSVSTGGDKSKQDGS